MIVINQGKVNALKSTEILNQAKLTLSSAISADIESSGYTWQVRNAIDLKNDLQNIQDAINEYNYAELAGDVTQPWRMADNTWNDVTIDNLEKVLSDYRLRKKELYGKYKVWTSGGMLEEFSI